MIYELLNEGYFDAAKMSPISIEDTKTALTNKVNSIKAEVISDFEKHVLNYYIKMTRKMLSLQLSHMNRR